MASYTTYGMGSARSSTLIRLRSVQVPVQETGAQERVLFGSAQPALPNIIEAPESVSSESARTINEFITGAA